MLKQDGRSQPHERQFVCTNANLRVKHAVDILPGDPTYARPRGESRIYVCPIDGSRMFSRRRVTLDLEYPEPAALLSTISTSKGWPYDEGRAASGQLEGWRTRDRALVCLLYLAMLRISEALRLRVGQFTVRNDRVYIEKIRLSKRTFPDWREEAWLPLNGERAPFTELFLKHLDSRPRAPPRPKDPSGEPDYGELVFPGYKGRPLSTHRGWEVVNALTGSFNHFFRALGEDYMVHNGVLLVDLGGYLKVDPSIISRYVHKVAAVPPI